MKIKVSEATPLQLNWLVAKCWDVEVEYINDGITRCLLKVAPFTGTYAPSTDWSQGGPIIEWEGIDLYCNVPTNMGHDDPSWRGSWRAKYHRCGFGTEMFYGPTPLIAAMRCYCCAELGDEVEIPEGLQ